MSLKRHNIEDAPRASGALMEKWVEATKAKQKLDQDFNGFRGWLEMHEEHEDAGVRLLACLLWCAELQTRLIQAQIIVKREEK